MTLPILLAVAGTAAGAALALLAGSAGWIFGAARTFAFAAVAIGVVAQLLPEALAEIGGLALLGLIAGLLAPALLARLAAAVRGRGGARRGDAGMAIELGYIALLVHKFGDGLGLGTFTGPAHQGHDHRDVILGIVGHSVPMTALVVLAVAARSGARAALGRAVGLALAAVLGVAASRVGSAELVAAAHPWVTALLAGVLLHVLAHDLPAPHGRIRAVRAGEVVGFLAGIALPLAAGGGGEHHQGAGLAIGPTFVDLVVETAPMLLAGIILGALVYAFGGRLPDRWLQGSHLGQAVRGAAIGAPAPICSCGILPIACAFRDRGAGPAFVVALLLATPEIGIDAFLLSITFLGWPLALIRLGAALLVAVVAALLVARFATRGASSGTAACAVHSGGLASGSRRPGDAAGRAREGLDEMSNHVLPWTVLGLVAAAYVAVVLPADALGSIGWLDVVLVSVLAIPAYVCAASATPLAAILIAKGLSPGAALAGLLLGAATNVATVGFLRTSYGVRAAAACFAGAVAVTWSICFAINGLGVSAPPVAATASEHGHGVVVYVAAAALGLLLLRSLWRTGLDGWLATLGLRHAHAHADHPDAGDGHDHACCGEHPR